MWSRHGPSTKPRISGWKQRWIMTRVTRSAEFVDVVKGLWDGWDDGALLLDKASGRYFDEAKMHVLNHHGRFFGCGPLNVACMPQGPGDRTGRRLRPGPGTGRGDRRRIYAISGRSMPHNHITPI